MHTHGEDGESKALINDFIKDTDFYICLGIIYLYFVELCQCFAVILICIIMCNTD